MIEYVVMITIQAPITPKDGRSDGWGSVSVGGSEMSKTAAVRHNVQFTIRLFAFSESVSFYFLCDGFLL